MVNDETGFSLPHEQTIIAIRSSVAAKFLFTEPFSTLLLTIIIDRLNGVKNSLNKKGNNQTEIFSC